MTTATAKTPRAPKTTSKPRGFVSVLATEVVVGDVLQCGSRGAHAVTSVALEDVRGHQRLVFTCADGNRRTATLCGRENVMRDLAVGMGATSVINGDHYPVTIREISASGHRITVSRDVTRTAKPYGEERVGDATSTPALFEVTDRMEVYTRRACGTYFEKGCEYTFLMIGLRQRRNDMSF